ncbi:SgcJ/EcaC family oxidoreductase [Kitasatospora aureofaciens]|uniref:SgcJ/EcaC family oxidoreductase n=1 Tax=Kitasatospora aureofaciens TaxID=1894 RepID=UPI0009989B68|nr:SgcJ/EcaC family oxidoreductase [Kitasatospora aureofaciens]
MTEKTFNEITNGIIDGTTGRITDEPTGARDVRAIREVVAVVERTQRAKDPDGFLALFRPDSLWTTAHGRVLVGFDAIAAFTREALPRADWDGEVTYEVAHVQFLRPDVAAVKVRQVYHGPGGDSEGTPLYLMSRDEDGRWLLHVGQNTAVQVG